jgi:hypothetical protein
MTCYKVFDGRIFNNLSFERNDFIICYEVNIKNQK